MSPAFPCYIVLQLPDDKESQTRIPQTGIPSTIGFVTSVYPVLPSVCLSVCTEKLDSHTMDFIKFDILGVFFFENLMRKFKIY